MKLFFLVTFLALFSGCSLIFEDDLSTQKVDLISPPNGYVTPTQTQTFIWDSLPGATQYRFQLVSQRFDYIEHYIVDTVLAGRRVTLSLVPRAYEWRVIGLNASSETNFYTHSLTIVNDTTLRNQVLNVIAPVTNRVYQKDSVAFLWSALSMANQYQVQVATDPSFNSQTLRKDTLTQQDFIYLIGDLGLGTFYYRLRAMRVGRDTTPYTAIQSFRIDARPIPRTPANNSAPTLPLNIGWQRASGIAKDSLFLFYNSTATPYQRLELSNNNYTFDNMDTTGYGSGVYYWQVKSVATNGLETERSNLWQFTIN